MRDIGGLWAAYGRLIGGLSPAKTYGRVIAGIVQQDIDGIKVSTGGISAYHKHHAKGIDMG